MLDHFSRKMFKVENLKIMENNDTRFIIMVIMIYYYI